MADTTDHKIFVGSHVRKSKDYTLKERLRTLILSKGMSENEFYSSLGLSRQVWYALSWGIWDCSREWKIKISQALETDSSVIWDNTLPKIIPADKLKLEPETDETISSGLPSQQQRKQEDVEDGI